MDRKKVSVTYYYRFFFSLNYIETQYEPLPDPEDLKNGADIIRRWVNKKQNDKITAFINSMVDFVERGGGYQARELTTFMKKIPKEFAFSLSQGLYKSSNGRQLINAVMGQDEGTFNAELLELFEVGA